MNLNRQIEGMNQGLRRYIAETESNQIRNTMNVQQIRRSLQSTLPVIEELNES